MVFNSYLLSYLTVAISFEQQTYYVNEDDGEVKPVLVLSNTLSAAITVEVFITNGSATGKH